MLKATSNDRSEAKEETAKGFRLHELFARPGFICLCLILATLAVYGPVRNHEFVGLDEPTYVMENPQVTHGLTLNGIAWAFTTDYAGNWHPLTWISHMLDVTLFGMGAAGPHIVNLLFHAVNGMLLFLVLRKLTFAHWRSAMVAALFALHPLHVESVAWVAERKDVLSTLFWMLTLWMYCGYARATKGWVRHYVLALLFFALGLMSKPMLVTIPFVLLLLDYWPLKRFTPEEGLRPFWLLVREKIPFFALALVVSVVTFEVQKKGGAVQNMAHYSIGQRVSNVVVAYNEYLGKTFWPARLAVFYPNPLHWPLWELLFCVGVIVGLTVAVICFSRRWRFLFTGWFWFLGTLVPVIGLVQVGGQAFADRYSYMPLFGIFIILVWGAGAIVIRWRIPASVSAAVGLAVVMACSAVTMNQLSYWQNSETLFRRALAATGDNFVAYCGLGYYYASNGRVDEAIRNYQLGYQIDPSDLQVLHNLGTMWFKQKNYDEAIHYFQLAIQVKPDRADDHSALGDVFFKLKRYDEAIAEYKLALQFKPDDSGLHCSLGDALDEAGKYPETIAEFTEALRLEPTSARAECGLGDVMDDMGKREEALKHFAEAMRLDPNYASAHYLMANLMVEIGQNDSALEQYSEALKCQPEFAEAENNLGTVLMRLGRIEEAEKHFRAVIQYEQSHVGAHSNLAGALMRQRRFDEAVAEYHEALRVDPDSMEAHFGIALALAQSGHRDEAITHLHEVLRLKPDLESAKQFLDKLEATPPAQ